MAGSAKSSSSVTPLGPTRALGELRVANNQARIDIAHQRLDLAIPIGRIERRHLRARGHAGIKRHRHVKTVAHQISDALAGNTDFGQSSGQCGDRLRVLGVSDFPVEAGKSRRIAACCGGVGQRMHDGRKIRVARIAVQRHGRHRASLMSVLCLGGLQCPGSSCSGLPRPGIVC
jgi:hypothetical protein